MREGAGAIEANIQFGHSTDVNFVFLREKLKQGQWLCPCKILLPSLHYHGNTQHPKTHSLSITFSSFKLSCGLIYSVILLNLKSSPESLHYFLFQNTIRAEMGEIWEYV